MAVFLYIISIKLLKGFVDVGGINYHHCLNFGS